MSEAVKKFFTYKGLPLVRKGNQLYYGNMYDDFVVWIEIKHTKKMGDIEVADKVKIRKMSTDLTKPNIDKQADTDSLYDALDIAGAWLKVKA